MLDNIAAALEALVDGVLDMMNAGRSLDEIVHTVRVPEHLAGLPYLQPVYDEPEFVVRNIWRQYGGWWDGNPARLKPPADEVLAREVAALAGGTSALVERARAVAEAGDLRLACQLVEWAAAAAPDDLAAQNCACRDLHVATTRRAFIDGAGCVWRGSAPVPATRLTRRRPRVLASSRVV